LLVRI